MTRKQHFTLRLNPETAERLTRQAERRGKPKTALAEQYIEEGIRMAAHPGIVFRDGGAGRRPALAGSRLDVWHIVETFHASADDPQATAEYFGLPPHLVAAALGYYAEYSDEIDAWIERNAALADELETAYRRRVASLAR